MGAMECKNQKPDCGTIEAEDVNFDLPGCLESLTDMAHTGKTYPRGRTSTSRALWSMSRALTAPVSGTDVYEPQVRRPSLNCTKAVSLDTYDRAQSSHSPVHVHQHSATSISVPNSIIEEDIEPIIFEQQTGLEMMTDSMDATCNTSSTITTQDLSVHMDSLNIQKHRASPSIEIIPAESVEEPFYLPVDDEDQDEKQQTVEEKLYQAMPQLPPMSTLTSSKQLKKQKKDNAMAAKLNVPGSVLEKHSLVEKRKKFLKKSTRVEEDTSDTVGASSKRHSKPAENDWDKIQEWMVWCIHENLDDTSEDDISPYNSFTPQSRRKPSSTHTLRHQLSDPRGLVQLGNYGHSINTRTGLAKTHAHSFQHESDNSNISPSTSAHLSTRHQFVAKPQLSLNLYDREQSNLFVNVRERSNSDKGNALGRDKTSSYNSNKTSLHTQPTNNKSASINQNRLSATAFPGLRPKNRSLDNPLFKTSGQSSFESSGSSHMNSFDSTGTHNDRPL